MSRPKVLTFCDYYLPGFKAGGPIRSIAHLQDHLGKEIDFSIITRDRDFQDLQPYDRPLNSWTQLGDSKVYYSAVSAELLKFISSQLSSELFDVLYLNSVFSPCFSLWPMLKNHLANPNKIEQVIIAPRGELAESALRQKSLKKKAMLNFIRSSGWWRRVLWQASSEHEMLDIRRVFGGKVAVEVASDLPPLVGEADYNKGFRPKKVPGHLKLVFLSRIANVKNLDFALKSLRSVQGNVQFDIWGPLVEPEYWKNCQALIEDLPSNVVVNYKGVVESTAVADVLNNYDLFYLPTKGENFGHAIAEAMSAGCPVLISDQTPWRQLQQAGSHDLSLSSVKEFSNILQQWIDMSEVESEERSQLTWTYARKISRSSSAVSDNRQLFFR